MIVPLLVTDCGIYLTHPVMEAINKVDSWSFYFIYTLYMTSFYFVFILSS